MAKLFSIFCVFAFCGEFFMPPSLSAADQVRSGSASEQLRHFWEENFPKDVLITNLAYDLSVNNKPGLLSFFPVPSATYVYKGLAPKNSLRLTTAAGLFNEAEWLHMLYPSFLCGLSASTFFLFAGDKPKIDGDDFGGIYNYDANYYQAKAEGLYRYKLSDRKWEAGLDYVAQFRDVTSFSRNPNFRAPNDVINHGPNLVFRSDERPLSEIREIGFFPSLSLGYFWQARHEPWGDTSVKRDADQYFRGAVGFDFALPLSSHTVLVWNSTGVWLSKADRLVAPSNGSITRDPDAMFLSSVKADQSAKGDIGIRFYLVKKRFVALRPYFFYAHYRELLPAETRQRNAYGAAAKFFGVFFKGRMAWDLQYGAVLGVHDEKPIHELKWGISYRWLPV